MTVEIPSSVSSEESQSSTVKLEEEEIELETKNITDGTEAQAPSKKPRFSALVVVYMIVFLDILGFGIIFPLLPFYAMSLGASGFELGIIVSAYPAANFIGSPILGRISDRVGRKPILLFSCFGLTICYLVLGFANSLWLLVLGRGFSGFCGSTYNVAQAYIADLTSTEERGKYMGYLGAIVGSAFVIGPAVAGLLSVFGLNTAAFVSCGLALVMGVVCIFVLKESTSATNLEKAKSSDLKAVLKKPIYLFFFSIWFFISSGFMTLDTTWPIMTAEQFGFTPVGVGLSMAGYGMLLAGVQVILGKMHKVFGEKLSLIIGCGMVAAGFFFAPFATHWVLVIIAMIPIALGDGIIFPSATTLLSINVPPDQQGFVLGIAQSCSSLAQAISPLFMGEFYDISYRIPYFVSAGFLILSLIISIYLPTKPITKASQEEAVPLKEGEEKIEEEVTSKDIDESESQKD